MSDPRPTSGVLRAMSDETVVLALLDAGRATRAELAAITALSKPTVTDAIRRLEHKGLVRDTGERTTGRGGVGTYYAAGAESGRALAVTIAPEGIAAEVVDAAGVTLSRSSRAVDRPTDPRTVRRLLTATARAALRDVSGAAPILAVVSAADPVDRTTGRLVHLPDAPFLVGELDPGATLSSLVDGEIVVDNDVNWAARHERAVRAHDGETLDDFAYLFLGEGLGGAIVADGAVRRGRGGLAGEVSHVLTAGARGAAVPFTQVFGDLGLHRPDSTAIDVGALLAALARHRTRTLVCAAVAGVVAAVVALTDPAVVVLGGHWGVDQRVLAGVRELIDAGARPVPVTAAREREGAAAAGARSAAVSGLRDLIAAAARA